MIDPYHLNKDCVSLEAWQACRSVKRYFYQKILPLLPQTEKHNLNIQIRRASISTTADIAEGYGRNHFLERQHFFRMARGSIFELKDHPISCHDLHYLDAEIRDEGMVLIGTAPQNLNGYIRYLQKNYQQVQDYISMRMFSSSISAQTLSSSFPNDQIANIKRFFPYPTIPLICNRSNYVRT